MATPTLQDLPAPPPGKTGWPWTKQSDLLPETQSDGSPWPKISIVTPSYNQGQFIEETIRSVLLQGYPDLEYIVMDGGSTDESVEIIQKYDPWIDYWVSEEDEGQSHAINKGLEISTGEVWNWLNSDDFLVPDALSKVGGEIEDYGVLVATGWRLNDSCAWKHETEAFTCRNLIIGHAYSEGCMFTQQAIWLRTEGVKNCGGIDNSIHYAMDRDLYIRYLNKNKTRVKYKDIAVAVFRIHDQSKTGEANNHFLKSQIRILNNLIYDKDFIDYRYLIQRCIKRIEWKMSVKDVISSNISSWKKISILLIRILEDPIVRFDRPTIAAIKQTVIP
jgi:glycosyltransferase involved in cell wall biosynthesis